MRPLHFCRLDGLRGPHSDGEEPLLRLFQQLALHQQHHELEFWRDEGVEKAVGGEADMAFAWHSICPLVRRRRLPLTTCSDPPDEEALVDTWGTKSGKVESPCIQQLPSPQTQGGRLWM